ncbi:VOC family protein [Leptolyngbya sp. FACHB-261]|uniref:VOC family protein n=1 Tax=Leptolyngbya sp. FACHB-261 TaxID=2692806 RepID=UPI001687955F|nr:VOC family protein [Leptolyngbya sp. FACHB-261]MBD2099972.1 VOC family protein [Leptolyngbya sp. FACHB-261]
MHTKFIPAGFHSVTPYLIVQGVNQLLEFVKTAFDAEEVLFVKQPDGFIRRAAVRIGDSMVEMSEAKGEWTPMPGAIHLYVGDTDVVYERSLQAGATSLQKPTDMYYGECSAAVKDPVGNHWYIATHTEDLPSEELVKREADFLAQQH